MGSKTEKHSGQSGAQKHSRTYVDPDFRKKKKAERDAIDERYAALCGPVEVKKIEPSPDSD